MSITIQGNTLCYFDNEHDGIRNINYFLVPHTLQECYLASQTYKMSFGHSNCVSL